MSISIEYLSSLSHSWSANVRLKNEQVISIWYTCLPSIKHLLKEVISVSSDYPGYLIKENKWQNKNIIRR